jgi:hypothetical protein
MLLLPAPPPPPQPPTDPASALASAAAALGAAAPSSATIADLNAAGVAARRTGDWARAAAAFGAAVDRALREGVTRRDMYIVHT